MVLVKRALIGALLITCGIGLDAAATKRILLVGDSYAQWPWSQSAFQTYLDNNYGSGTYEVEGTYTAIGGSQIWQWTSNVAPDPASFPPPSDPDPGGDGWGLLERLDYSLDLYPSIDIVHLSIGANDILYNWTTAWSSEETAVLLAEIATETQNLIDHILALRPDIKILLAGYDYFNVTETCTQAFPDYNPQAVLLMSAMGFSVDVNDLYQNKANQAVLNTLMAGHGLTKLGLAQNQCRVDYVQNYGNVQFRVGYVNALEVWYEPGEVAPPGIAPDYYPFPGGDVTCGSPPFFMDDLGGGVRDHLHLGFFGFEVLFQNCVEQYYHRWLTDEAAPQCTAISCSPAGPTNADTVTFTLTFSEDVQDLEVEDVALAVEGLNGAEILGLSGTGSEYAVEVATGTPSGARGSLDIAFSTGATVYDGAWNPLDTAVPAHEAVVVDKTAPVPVLTGSTWPTKAPRELVVDFGEPVSGFEASDLAVVNGAVVYVADAGEGAYAVTIQGASGENVVGVTLEAGAAVDAASNPSEALAEAFEFVFDDVAPVVEVSAPSVSHAARGPVEYTVTYTGADGIVLEPGYVELLAEGTATGVVSVSEGKADTRVVAISDLSGVGTLGIRLDPGSAYDVAGNVDYGTGPSETFEVDALMPLSAWPLAVALAGAGGFCLMRRRAALRRKARHV